MNAYELEGPSLNSDQLSGKNQLTALLVVGLVCCYLVITSTVSLFPETPIYDVKRISEIILLFFVILLTLINKPLRIAFAGQLSGLPSRLALGLTLFFVLGIASSIANASSPRGLIYSLTDVGLLVLLFVLALIVAACRNLAGSKFDRLAISLIAILGLAVGVQELSGFWAARSIGSSYNFNIALVYFSFPRMYNQIQTWTIPVVTALPFVFSGSKLAKVLCIITLGLNWYVLLVTGARGSVVSLVLAFFIAASLSSVARKVLLKWQLAGIFFGIVLYAGLLIVTALGTEQNLTSSQSFFTTETKADTSITSNAQGTLTEELALNQFYKSSVGRPLLHTTGRSKLWRAAVEYARAHPFMGIGPMNFACKGPTGRLGSPHNFLLQILSEWGIPATLVLFLILFPILGTLLKGLKLTTHGASDNYTLHLMLITAVLAAMVHLMVSSLLISPASQVAAALVVGWLIGVRRPFRKIGRTILAPIVLSGTILGSLLLLNFSFHEMTNMTSYHERLPAGDRGYPRFWQFGKACSDRI